MTASDEQNPEQDPSFNPQSAYPNHPGYQAPPAQYPTQYPAQYPPQYQQPYGQPQHPAQYPPQYQQPYGQPQYPVWPQYGPPEHPKATLAFILGLVGGPAAFATCGLSLLAAPFAWYFAALVRREVKAEPGRWSQENSKVTAGFVLGIIGTVLLALAFLGIAVLIVVAIADPGAFDSGTTV